ncbi:unnamed protein product, partial [Brugia pahangi]
MWSGTDSLLIILERTRGGDIRYSSNLPKYCNWHLPVIPSSTQSDRCQLHSIDVWHARERGLIPKSLNQESASIIEWQLSERRPIIGANC